MPRTPLHTLIWSQDHACYELFSFGQVPQPFVPGDEEAWQAWLDAQDSFAFRGRQGRLNVYKEARPRGDQYWYAYHTTSKRTHKRYLGRTAKVTFARLEEIAEVLTREEQFHKTEQSFGDTTRRSFTLQAQPERQTPAPPSLRPGQAQQASLLLPKLRPPRLPSLCISRQRLLARLEEGRQDKLTLVLAPAGSGKTTLVRQWIEAQGQDTQAAWLSLDPEDDDPIRFWHYVLTACGFFEGEPGYDALKLLSTNQSFFTLLLLKQILTSFLNDAARLPSRLLLVLDDYHVISSSQIHESLAYLVDHLPPTLHLIVATRAEPALPLARWRARGDLQEIDAADLRFSPAESTSFLHQALPFALPKDQLQSLEARLEGWPTGFRLLALALQGKSEREEIEQMLTGFSGSHRYLLDYFALEVLSSLPEARQIFLLRTSLLGRMTASLCDAVTRDQESEQTLREMGRSGLFLQALGGEPPWYRYHSLFAEALQAQARKRLGEEELRRCLSRASAWYEQQEMFAEGIEAALSASEWMRAAALIERVLKVENHPAMQERVTLLRWVELLPEPVLEAHQDLCVYYAAALLFTLDRSSPATMALIEEPLKRAERAYEREQAWGKLGEALSCHAEVARWHGDIPLAQSLARRALTLPPEPPMLWRGASILTVVASEMQAGRPEEARRLTLEGQQRFETLPIPGYSIHGATLMVGEIALQQGRLHQAQQYYRQLLVTAKENPVDQMAARLGLAKVFYEWNQLAEAEQNVAQVLELGKAHLDELGTYFVEVGVLFPGSLLQARLYQARGDLARAQQALQKLLAFAQEHQLTSLYRMAQMQQVELALATGLLPSVEDWQATSPDEAASVMQQEREDLLRAHVLIARGEITEALRLLGKRRRVPGGVCAVSWRSMCFSRSHTRPVRALSRPGMRSKRLCSLLNQRASSVSSWRKGSSFSPCFGPCSSICARSRNCL